jgi:protocatechuate 4,5-dioxygenase beta chain
MSHQISGARFGIANEDFDRYFLRTLPQGLKELAAIPQEDYMRYGGTDSVELVLWFVMRAALSEGAQPAYSFHTFPQITGCGVLAMSEPDAAI